jgi:hypothetical protein
MNGADEGLDTFLTERRLAIGALIDWMLLRDAVRHCRGENITAVDVDRVFAHLDALGVAEAESDAPVVAPRLLQ